MAGIHKFVLENGVRVLVEPVGHVGSASIGLWCKTGSVDERADEGGITHLIEHMLFKGTGRRTAKQIAEEIEGRGGMLNAFTDKEQTCYYCRVLAGDAPVGVDVLSDMMTGSLIDLEELEREKGVVLEEIKRGEDEPGDHVHDLHLQGRWPDHPLGKPIIGTPESVSSFLRPNLANYMDRQYRGGNVVLAVAGNVDPEAFRSLAQEKLGGIQPGSDDRRSRRPAGKAGENLVAKDVEQVHFCIGTDGVSLHDDDLYPAVILDGILGGGMSSRLFQEIRERRGLAYAIGSYNQFYTAGGAFTVYGGTGLKTWEETREVVRRELDKVMADGVPQEELERVQRNISGSLVLSMEGMNTRMIRMARNEIVHGREIPVEETLAKIAAVTVADVVTLARKHLPEDQMRTTAIGPF